MTKIEGKEVALSPLLVLINNEKLRTVSWGFIFIPTPESILVDLPLVLKDQEKDAL